ncbi:hypothetical protein K474DRAFT_1656851 [Panus rudis PR-1116 ss-1]|nr:hypothetical protein K474DRAFT_1656851 [Panus rudis PR-1116 ss-1]
MMFENPEIFDHLARVLEFWPASDHFGAPQAPKITILRLHVVRIPEIWLKLALRPSREKIPNSRTTFLRIFGGPGSPQSSTDGNSPTPATGGDSSAGGAAADNHDNTTGDNSAGSALHQDATTTVPDGNTTSDDSGDTSNVPDGDETSGNNEAQGISGNTDSTVVPTADDQSSTNPTGSDAGSTSTGDQGSSSSATAATTSDDASSGATANTTATQGPDNLDSTDASATDSQANTNTNPDSTDSGSASPGDQSSSSTADGSTSDNGTSVSAGTADSSTDTTPTASGTSGSSDTAADSGTSDNTPANGAPSTTGDTNFGPFNDFDAASPDVSGSHASANPNRGTHRTDRVASDCGGTACVAQELGSPVGGVSADPVTGLMRTGTGGVLGAMGECTGQTDIGVCVDIATG